MNVFFNEVEMASKATLAESGGLGAVVVVVVRIPLPGVEVEVKVL